MNHSRSVYMSPQAFTEQYGVQLRKALPSLVDLPIVKLRMSRAMDGGLNWGDGLACALAERHAIAALRAASRPSSPPEAQELQSTEQPGKCLTLTH